jgi:DNA-binding beta-propeller fold protein YncE
MIWKRNVALFVSIAALLMGLAGCASVKKEVEMVWPLPPDEPKIKFVEILRSAKDVEGTGGLEKAILGDSGGDTFTRPYGVATDAEGRIYATDVGRVFVFDKKNKKLSFIGDEPGTGKLSVPMGIVVSRKGKVYVADSQAKRVFVYDLKGTLLTAFGRVGEMDTPTGVAIDEKRDRLYVADTKKHTIIVYALADGKLLKTIGEKGSGELGKFNLPTNIILDRTGNLYVTDTGNFRVQILEPDGKPIRSIGQIGDKLGNFSRPKGIALDSEDNLYVVDSAFNNIQIFNKDGKPLLVVGEGGYSPGKFQLPSGIFIDDDDRIIVVDGMNGRLQVLQYLSEKWKKQHPDAPKWVAPKADKPKTDAPASGTPKATETK